jgi:hypothetical protein
MRPLAVATVASSGCSRNGLVGVEFSSTGVLRGGAPWASVWTGVWTGLHRPRGLHRHQSILGLAEGRARVRSAYFRPPGHENTISLIRLARFLCLGPRFYPVFGGYLTQI